MARITETYAAALQHDIADVPDGGVTVGVVRRPTGWFHALVDENVPELGPPDSLLDETKDRQSALKRRGLCDEEAHNAAWDEVDFESKYRDYLETTPEAKAAVDSLVDRIESGTDVTLVCFEGETKRCHRHLLLRELEDRVG